MDYLAVIDHDHLDNALFLTTLAQSLEKRDYEEDNYILLHGDSEYTDRIMQSGVMREDAIKRSIRGLNHRLVALLADEGISAIGLNGFQRQLISRKNGNLQLDREYLESLPTAPIWLISSLIQDLDNEERAPLSLPDLAKLVAQSLDIERTYLFTRTEEGWTDQLADSNKLQWNDLSDEFQTTYIPGEFQDFNHPIRLTTGKQFGNIEEEDAYIDIG